MKDHQDSTTRQGCVFLCGLKAFVVKHQQASADFAENVNMVLL